METLIIGNQKIQVSEIKRLQYCYPGQSLQEVLDSITDASADNTYTVLMFPGAVIKDAQRKDFVTIGFSGPAHDIVFEGYVQLDFQGITIAGITAEDVDLRDSVLSSMTILGGSLKRCSANSNECFFLTCRQVDFSEASLDSLELQFSKFFQCTFSNASFINNQALFATFANCDFTDCDLSGTNLSNAKIDGSSFIGANLTDVVLPAYASSKADFKEVVGGGHWDAETTIWTDGNPIG